MRHEQALADKQREIDAKHSPNRDVDADTGAPGDLFPRRTHRDIEDTSDVKPKRGRSRSEHIAPEGDTATRDSAVAEDLASMRPRQMSRGKPHQRQYVRVNRALQ